MTAAALASLLTADGTIASHARRSACSTSLFFALRHRCSCRRPRSSYRWLAWVVIISSRHRLASSQKPSFAPLPQHSSLTRAASSSYHQLADQQQAHCSVHGDRSSFSSLRRCSIRSSRSSYQLVSSSLNPLAQFALVAFLRSVAAAFVARAASSYHQLADQQQFHCSVHGDRSSSPSLSRCSSRRWRCLVLSVGQQQPHSAHFAVVAFLQHSSSHCLVLSAAG
jgi:hypothetical protein